MEREWTPPSSQTRRYYGVGLKLRELGPQTFLWKDTALRRSELDGLTDVDVVRSLPGDDDPTAAELLDLAVVLASRVLGRRARFRRRTRRVTRDELLEQWDALADSLTRRAMERAKDDVRYEVGAAYKARRRHQQVSVSDHYRRDRQFVRPGNRRAERGARLVARRHWLTLGQSLRLAVLGRRRSGR